MNQSGFTFDQALTEMPKSQLPPPAAVVIRPENTVMVERIVAVLPGMADDISIEEPLLTLGIKLHSICAWERARCLDAFVGVFQAYYTDDQKLRFRRLPEHTICPGFGDETCTEIMRGGRRCKKHSAMEEEDLWNW